MTTTEIKISKKLEEGIEFSCQMCGNCCTGFNEGEVYLYKEDILRLAKFLNIKGKNGLRTFAEKYVKVINDSFFWKESGTQRGKTYRFKTLGFKFTGEDEHCHFLKKNRCSVHVARPFQCRSFPFWQMMVSSRKNFENYTKKCEGLQFLKGTYYSREEILNWAKEEYQIEKNYFLEMKEHNFDILKVYPFLSKKMLQE
ncbi:MAG: YkgJ family cysteine cluster protein [Promethearchaeota archaeon]|nr:MAG: YkgJ family cysteine cluster protein [Candidatus Lokiarchaeota archaeon]